jgi:hypothetical protein
MIEKADPYLMMATLTGLTRDEAKHLWYEVVTGLRKPLLRDPKVIDPVARALHLPFAGDTDGIEALRHAHMGRSG